MLGYPWLLAAVVLWTCGAGGNGQCWDFTGCRDLDSEEKIMRCIWQCSPKQLISEVDSVLPNHPQNTMEEEEKESLGVMLSSVAQDDALQGRRSSEGPYRSDDRPSYSMEHFRWGKPMGRKRRPIKVYTSGSVYEGSPEEQSVETVFPSQSRRELDSSDEGGPVQKKNMKSNDRYRMPHFRWNASPAAKRYGGFMKTWSEKSSRPLITLLRNIIVKDGQ